MDTYPTSPVPQYVVTQAVSFKTLVTTYENGVEQRRSKWPTGMFQFTLQYNALKPADITTLWAFYVLELGSGKTFNFTVPDDQSSLYGNTYAVRFVDDNFSFDAFAHKVRSTKQIQLKQVF